MTQDIHEQPKVERKVTGSREEKPYKKVADTRVSLQSYRESIHLNVKFVIEYS